MFGDEDSPQELLIKNHVEYGGKASDLWQFRWANGELVFPPAEHAHANARRQANLKSRLRGSQWQRPQITNEMFILFEANDEMLSLYHNSKAEKSNPAPSNMSTNKSRRSRANDGDDDDTDFSFTNEAAAAEKATTTSFSSSKKNKKTRVIDEGELSNALAACNLGGKEKKQLVGAVYEFISNGDSKGLKKFVLDSGEVFISCAENIQLLIGAHQPLIPNMSVSESSRQSDNGLVTRRSLFIKISIRHPCDAKYVSASCCVLRVMFFHSCSHLYSVHSVISVSSRPR